MWRISVVFLAWLLVLGLVYITVDRYAVNPNSLEALGDNSTVTLKRGMDGHYRGEALINGVRFSVLVDTGASGVTLSKASADQLGLVSHDAIRTTTANGDGVGYVTRLDDVQIGGIRAKDVSAVIAPGYNGDILLGMSFLARMDVRLVNNTLTIKPRSSE